MWGRETSEPVAGSYERAHGWKEGDSEQRPCRLFSRKQRMGLRTRCRGDGGKRAESLYDDNPASWSWITSKNQPDSQKQGRGDLF